MSSFEKRQPWRDAGREISLYLGFLLLSLQSNVTEQPITYSKPSFRTEHVVKLIGMVTKSQPVLVLMEFMENGDLENFLRGRRQGIKFLCIILALF